MLYALLETIYHDQIVKYFNANLQLVDANKHEIHVHPT
jgi:hypothetical protein